MGTQRRVWKIAKFLEVLFKMGQFFLTRSCPLCFSPTPEIICSSCLPKLIYLSDSVCETCGQIVCDSPDKTDHKSCSQCLRIGFAFDWHRSVLSYEGAAAELIQQYKYDNKPFLAPFFASLIHEAHSKYFVGFDYVVPVPLSRDRLKQRTYNQSLEIAKIVAKKNSLTCLYQSLQKIEETAPQAQLSFEQRQKNLNKAFIWRGSHSLLGKKILLIDDVFTTGSTLNTCARVLKEGGAQKVGCVTASLTLKKV